MSKKHKPEPPMPDLGGEQQTTPEPTKAGKAGKAGKAPAKPVVDGGTLVVTGPPKEFKITASSRDITEIVNERLVFNESQTGVKVSEDTPLEEVLPILDYFTGLHEHVGFFIGDVLVFAAAKFGDRFQWAMEKTGRAMSTVKGYETVARAVPPDLRNPKLSFWHHQTVARIADKKVVKTILSEAAGSRTTAPMSVKQLRDKVNTEHPKPATKKKEGKAGKKPATRKEAPPYEPTAEELAAIDGMFDVLSTLDAILKDKVTPKGKDWSDMYIKMSHAAKKGLCSSLKTAADLYQRVSFKLGYG